MFQLLVKFDSAIVPTKTERKVSPKTDNLGFINTITYQHTIFRNFNFLLVFKTSEIRKTSRLLSNCRAAMGPLLVIQNGSYQTTVSLSEFTLSFYLIPSGLDFDCVPLEYGFFCSSTTLVWTAAVRSFSCVTLF